MTAAEFLAAHQIRMHGIPDIPPPVRDFMLWPAQVQSAIAAQGFTNPTPIQCASWPVVLKGHDIVAIAKTGSGKTCGFVLPAMQHIQKVRERSRWGDKPIALVLAPTRELACQIETEVCTGGCAVCVRASVCVSRSRFVPFFERFVWCV